MSTAIAQSPPPGAGTLSRAAVRPRAQQFDRSSAPHYIFNPGLDIDVSDCTLPFPMLIHGRLMQCFDISYEVPNQEDDALMKENDNDVPEVIEYTKKAAHQVAELLSLYDSRGVTVIESLINIDEEIAVAVEGQLLPSVPRRLEDLLTALVGAAADRARAIPDKQLRALAESVREEMIAACQMAQEYYTQYLDTITSEQEERRKSDGRGRATYDHYDQRVAELLGRELRPTAVQQVAASQQQAGERDDLIDLAEYKECEQCAEYIKIKAKVCRFCRAPQAEAEAAPPPKKK